MKCSSCGRVWHVGGPQCPTCGAPAIEEARRQPEAASRPAADRRNRETGGHRQPIRLSRRDFIIGALAGGAAATIAVLLPVRLTRDGDGAAETPQIGEGPAVVLATFPRQRIASLSDLKAGEPVDFEYPLQGQRSFLIKLGEPARGGVGPDTDIVAFSYMCTHMGCPLVGLYKDEHKVLGPCTCHYSTFDLRHHGMVVLGQATQNLPQITLAIEGDDIYATGVMGLIYGFSSNLAEACATEAAS